MRFPTVRAVVFDAVGTLLFPDPPAPAAYAEVARRFGSRLTPEDICRRFAAAFEEEEALDRLDGLRTSESREIERWRSIVSRVLNDVSHPEACFHELFAYFSRPRAWRCGADVPLVFKELVDRGLILGIASNHDRRLRLVQQGMQALQPVRHLVISSEVGWRKPASQFFAQLCRVVGHSPQEILFVGDHLDNDYKGAQEAGLPAILLDAREKYRSLAISRIKRLTELVEGARIF